MTNAHAHVGNAMALLMTPLHKRRGFTLLASGLIVALACLPGFINSASRVLYWAINPGQAVEGPLAQSTVNAILPTIAFGAGVTLIWFGSSRRVAQKRALLESVLAAYIAEASGEVHTRDIREMAPVSIAHRDHFAIASATEDYLAGSALSAARSAAASATAASAAA